MSTKRTARIRKEPKQLFLLLFFGLMMVKLLGACKPEADKFPYITTPADIIRLNSIGQEETLEVKTNQKEWTFACPADWVFIKKGQGKNKVVVTATEHLGLVARETDAVLVAGGVYHRIKIQQSGQGITFGSGPSEIHLSSFSGETTLNINESDTEWTVEESSADWLVLEAKPKRQELVLNVEENTKDGERSVRITLDSGGEKKVLNITQEGRSPYFLPFFAWGKNIQDVLLLENIRNNQLRATPYYLNESTPGRPDYQFATQNRFFPYVSYETVDYGDTFIYRTTLTASSRDVLFKGDYQVNNSLAAFLKKEGFVILGRSFNPRTGDGGYYMINKGKKIEGFLISKERKYSITFTPIVEQPKAMKSLEKLYTLGELKLKASTPKDVAEYEQKTYNAVNDTILGNTLSAQNKITIQVYPDVDPFYARWYFFLKDPSLPSGLEGIWEGEESLVKARYIFSSLDHVFYKWGGLYLLTHEFRQLLERNGYKEIPHMRGNQTATFISPDKELLTLTVISYNGQEALAYDLE